MKKSKPQKPKKKPKPKESEPDDTAKMNEEFVAFQEFVPARRFARHLRTWLLEFLEYDGSTEAPYLQDLVIDLQFLFDLLDKIEQVQGGIEERE
jgi:hypothetical protein